MAWNTHNAFVYIYIYTHVVRASAQFMFVHVRYFFILCNVRVCISLCVCATIFYSWKTEYPLFYMSRTVRHLYRLCVSWVIVYTDKYNFVISIMCIIMTYTHTRTRTHTHTHTYTHTRTRERARVSKLLFNQPLPTFIWVTTQNNYSYVFVACIHKMTLIKHGKSLPLTKKICVVDY